MAERNESTTTSGAVASTFATISVADGASSFEVHWTAYTSEAECAAGETVIVVAKDPSMAPVIKATVSEVHHLGYAATPTISGSIVGTNLLLDANGVALKDITWVLRIEQS
jgi:hypothetical protein